MARLITFKNLSAAPWKNGGGSTTEMLVSPPGAGFNDFDWRISVATITQDGAFSIFPGIDRSLVLLDGESLALNVDGAAVTLDAHQPLLRFAGETPVFASVAAPSTDFNVMTRRASCRHTLDRVSMTAAPLAWRRRGASTLVFLAGGECATVVSSVDGVGQAWQLGRHDALVLDPSDAGDIVVKLDAGAHPDTRTIVCIVEIITN